MTYKEKQKKKKYLREKVFIPFVRKVSIGAEIIY
jgi:hypothetical protein